MVYTNQNDRPSRNTQISKVCYVIGYYITNPDKICHNKAKAHIYDNYMDITEKKMIKPNTYMYKKDRKEKTMKAKKSKMDEIIRTTKDEGHTTEEMTPIIHMETQFSIESDIENGSSIGDGLDRERHMKMEDMQTPVVKVISKCSPSEPPPSQEIPSNVRINKQHIKIK